MITLTSKEKKWTWLFLLPFYFLYGQYLFSIVFLLIGWVFNLNIINESTDAYFNLLYLGFVSVCALYVFKPFLKKSIQHMKGRWIREIIYSCTSGTLKFYCANIVSSLLIMLEYEWVKCKPRCYSRNDIDCSDGYVYHNSIFCAFFRRNDF